MNGARSSFPYGISPENARRYELSSNQLSRLRSSVSALLTCARSVSASSIRSCSGFSITIPRTSDRRHATSYDAVAPEQMPIIRKPRAPLSTPSSITRSTSSQMKGW